MLWIQMDGQTVLMLHAAMLEHIKMFCHVNQPIFPLGEESRSIYHRDCADDHEQKIESNEMININQSMYSRTHELK